MSGPPIFHADGSPDFDPVWGTLGTLRHERDGGWSGGIERQADGVVVDVELLGEGLHLSGKIDLGRFDRLSGWLNMQRGFIQLRDAVRVQPGRANDALAEQRKRTLWVRLNQIVVVAEKSAIQRIRSGAPIVEKQRRQVSILTRGFELSGNIHIHVDGEIGQFLDATDPNFLPITELTVRWLSGPALLARFPVAMVNREQLVTLLEPHESPEASAQRQEVRSA